MNFLFYFPSWKPYKESINSFWHNIQSRNFYFIFPLGSLIKYLLFLPAQHTIKELLFYLPSGKPYKESIIPSGTTYGQGTTSIILSSLSKAL